MATNKWPYTDFHELNLDWILGKVKNIDSDAAVASEAAEQAAESATAAQGASEAAISAAASIASGSPKVVTLASEMTDTDLIYLYEGTEEGYNANEWYYYDGAAWVSGGVYGGGVISAAARSLLIYILQHASYEQTGMAAFITQLDTALRSGETSYYNVSNNLVHVTSNNSALVVASGSAYTATLTADEDYTLDRVTVLMGGIDITSDVYSAGVIAIASVSGDITINAVAVDTRETLFGVFSDGYTSAKGTVSGQSSYRKVWRQTVAARATVPVPFANNGYVFTVTDSSKYNLAAYDVTDDTPIATTFVSAVDGVWFEGGAKSVAWATSDSVSTSYVWLALKKMDGTAFTAEELAHGAKAVFNYTSGS